MYNAGKSVSLQDRLTESLLDDIRRRDITRLYGLTSWDTAYRKPLQAVRASDELEISGKQDNNLLF
jgi:hypothetical protein